MRRAAAATALALWAALVSAQVPHLEIAVEVDPGSGAFAARAELTSSAGGSVALALPALEIDAATLDGRALPATVREGAWRADLPPGARLQVEYRARLASLDDTLSHREVLAALLPAASAEGSYLPAGSGWYPDPGMPFTYRIEIVTPHAQIAVAPGVPADLPAAVGKRRVAFEHAHPVDGIDLMIGPYTVTGRTGDAGGTRVRLRTYFHAELRPLAQAYLDSAAGYVQRYSREIGAYPFENFSIVSSPLPTGFGMPTLTYLGRQVLKLPFIRHTSLGHEVLHNWWGNGVRVDVSRGNWAEGLTTFMADYAYKEDEAADAAKEMRHGWLRDFAALPAGADRPLSEFRARHHTASSAIGYGKSAMLFVELRDRLGEPVFNQGIRRFWQAHRHRAASFDDLRRAFEQAAGQDLGGFFDQRLDRPGAPRLAASGAELRDGKLFVTLTQDSAGYRLRVPLALEGASGVRTAVVDFAARETRFALGAARDVRSVTVDPAFRVWRALAPSEAPPILRDAVAAERLQVRALDDALRTSAQALARAFAEGDIVPADDNADGRGAPLLVAGAQAAIDAEAQRLGLAPRPAEARNGDVQVWIAPDAARRVVLVSLPEQPEAARAALELLARRLPHLARYAWLSFDGERIAGRGTWPARSPVVEVRR